MKKVQEYVCIAIGILFLFSGVSKIIGFMSFIQSIGAYQLFPNLINYFFGIIIIITEIIGGLLCLKIKTQRIGLAVICILITEFLALSTYAIIVSIHQMCNCFLFVEGQNNSP
ncbi:hypothetical protein KAR48_15385, partial [bacterium]|nr:hypothetical protein [bacterium]